MWEPNGLENWTVLFIRVYARSIGKTRPEITTGPSRV